MNNRKNKIDNCFYNATVIVLALSIVGCLIAIIGRLAGLF